MKLICSNAWLPQAHGEAQAAMTGGERTGSTPPAGAPLTGPGSSAEPGDEGIRWQRPSPRLLRARRIQAGLATAPTALGAGLILGAAVSSALGLVTGLGLAAAGLLGERFLARRVAAWGYAERNDDLIVRRGVLIRRQSVIPYGRMQFIDVTAGPVERSLGLATLRMHTAAAASDARIPGLDRAVAAKLRDQLAALGEAQAAGPVRRFRADG
jgi:membrane protein YdbS with pleckstrin-like domain